jgi:hypothetical protein
MAHPIEDLAMIGVTSELGDRSNPILLSDEEEEDVLTAGEEGAARKEASSHVSVSHEGWIYRQSPWTYIDSIEDDPAYQVSYYYLNEKTYCEPPQLLTGICRSYTKPYGKKQP